MKKVIFLIFLSLFFVFHASAYGAYRLYLKNGSVISEITNYEKMEGEIKFYFKTGVIGIPEEEIIRIEEYEKEEAPPETAKEEKPSPTPPPVPPPKPSVPAKRAVPAKQAVPAKRAVGKARVDALRLQLSEIESRLAYIKTKEDRLEQVNADYNMTKLRIENLFQKSRTQELSPIEKQQNQMNFLRKRKLEEEAKQLKEELEPLMNEKLRLIQEKTSIEAELRASED